MFSICKLNNQCKKECGFFNVNLSNVNIIPNTYTEDGGKELPGRQ